MPLPPGKGGQRPGGRPHLKFAPRSVPSLLPLITHRHTHHSFLIPHPTNHAPSFEKVTKCFQCSLIQGKDGLRNTRRHDTNVSLANTWYKPLSPSHPSAFPIPHFQYRKVPMPITVRNLNSDLSL